MCFNPCFAKFQFLIGRLKTVKSVGKNLFNHNEFQFLIGRLKTGKRGEGRMLTMKFQFLIGRLKTCVVSTIVAGLFICFNSL